MGYIKHHAIIVIGWDDSKITAAHEAAIVEQMAVSNIVASPVNGYRSFFIAPDGSKEGWTDSDEGNARRDAFIQWLRSAPGLYLTWAEVELDCDGDAVRLGRHSEEA